MKKFSLTKQFIFIFILVLLLTTAFFSAILTIRLSSIGEVQNYNRLSLYIDATAGMWKQNEEKPMLDNYLESKDNHDIEFVMGNYNEMKNIKQTPSLIHYLNTQEVQEILTEITIGITNGQLSKNEKVQNKRITEKGIIYTIFQVDNKTGNFIIVCSSNQYVSNLKNTTGYQLIFIFTLVLVFGTSIIILWSRDVTKRIQGIQSHVLNMPKNSYKDVYTDNGFDEISQLSEAIEDMRKEILSNEQTKQEMLQNVSHDFKTPIAVIKSYAEAIADRVEGIEKAEIIIEQCDLLKNKVAKLLQYNRLEYLTKDKEFEEVLVSGIIHDIVMNYKHRSKIKIITTLDDTTFKGYRENLYTIVDNIVDNATRYAKSKIVIILNDGVLRIFNDGDPIDKQFLNAVFKPYEKGSNGQFGLGMSIVKRTLEFFELKLEVVNEKNGVCFVISK